MQVELAKHPSPNYRVDSSQGIAAPRIDLSEPIQTNDKTSAVNLKYFQKSHECFSSWQQRELKDFSNWVAKVSTKTEQQITSVTQTCHAHRGKPKAFPQSISPDVKMYSMDVGAKTRVHGFFASGNFYLVWLDRAHAILKT
jgi:hypothetical protein